MLLGGSQKKAHTEAVGRSSSHLRENADMAGAGVGGVLEDNADQRLGVEGIRGEDVGAPRSNIADRPGLGRTASPVARGQTARLNPFAPPTVEESRKAP